MKSMLEQSMIDISVNPKWFELVNDIMRSGANENIKQAASLLRDVMFGADIKMPPLTTEVAAVQEEILDVPDFMK